MSAQPQIKTWANTQEEEDYLNEDHAPLWRCLIDRVEEKNLENKHVLDFGCNQGGFLRMLYQARPFHKAVGVDIASDSIEVARKLRAGMPMEFGGPDLLDKYRGQFEVAFSHEVIYLLPDLEDHARTMYQSLASRGVYYAVAGCYKEMPLWPRWRKVVSEYSNVPVPDYSLDDYAAAFFKAGFKVTAQRYKLEGFVRIREEKTYFPGVLDYLDYFGDQKIIFRLEKPE